MALGSNVSENNMWRRVGPPPDYMEPPSLHAGDPLRGAVMYTQLITGCVGASSFVAPIDEQRLPSGIGSRHYPYYMTTDTMATKGAF